MVPKEERLPYRDFYASGYKIIKTNLFTLKVRVGGVKKNRFGVVIAKSTEKSAVRRNFWKRQARSVFVSIPERSLDFVLIFNSGIRKTTPSGFKKELLIALG